jgi:hypothetical protein
MKLKIIVAGVAFALSGVAQADVALGTIGASAKNFGNIFLNVGSLGSALGRFSDHYTFTLAGSGTAVGRLGVGVEWGSLDLTLTQVSLSGGTLADKLTDATPESFSFSNLGAGTYTLDVSGVLDKVPGSVGFAFYSGSIQSVASAAPEPEALALMLAGLAGVGLATRRRLPRS